MNTTKLCNVNRTIANYLVNEEIGEVLEEK